ncbi:hypothetical protein CVT25_015660 [Psilocybe cyanescens]|uniref:Uncharacterized protein n=1 Tax=Psilocybe cyanescens TaxID=93625 RepID=A0A409XA21_PSICY|nr:hypothetical protein CVT25_015660 [Psilocybe cyanescens]
MYRNVRAQLVLDLQSITNVIGRIPRGKDWGIVDRSGNYSRTVFIHTDDAADDGQDDDDNVDI